MIQKLAQLRSQARDVGIHATGGVRLFEKKASLLVPDDYFLDHLLILLAVLLNGDVDVVKNRIA